MKDRAAAHRFARALEAALPTDAEIEKVADELSAVALFFDADPESADALTSPAMPAVHRAALLDTLARIAGLSPTTARFLELLHNNDRLGLVPETARAMESIRDRRLGIVEAEVTTAVPINGSLAERTKQTLESTTGRKIRMAMRTDPSILGGVVARVGSTVFDGSLRTRLEALRTQIARG